MRFWQMIDEGLVKIRQQRSGNPAGFPRNFPPFQLQMHGDSASSLQSPSMLAILSKRNYSSDVVKPILAFASRVIQ